MRTLIIIPAYNEQDNIKRVVDNLIDQFPQYSYIIVNDGSSDNTENVCKENGYNIISHPVNLGLDGAFRTGMMYARENNYDYAVQFDGDGQHRAEYIADMIKEIENGNDIVIGSRFVTEKKPKTLRMLGNNLIQSAIKITTGKKISDPTSGLRIYNKNMIEILANAVDLGPEPDTLALLMRHKVKISEVQVKMDERIAGESYLNFSRSVLYMTRMFISILLLQWFRKGK